MKEIKKNVTAFLDKYGMGHAGIDIESNCRIFLNEMEAGLSGEKSSLEMIPTYIETGKKVPLNTPVIVMDAGGTNFRGATAYFDDSGKFVVENFRKARMPGIEREVSKEEFFETMAGNVSDIAGASDKIGFCFSYPTEMSPSKDGKLIRFAKEIKAPQVPGQMIGENLRAAFAAAGKNGNKHIVILNDTVTTLLAGIESFPLRRFSSYIGFILGTGTNACYIESNRNITKANGLDPAGSMVINCECGGYNKAPQGEFDREFEASTHDPEVHPFEKKISGAYLGPLCSVAVRFAIKDGLFGSETAKSLGGMNFETKDVSKFVLNSYIGSKPAQAVSQEQDRATLYVLFDEMIERAAKLSAINLSSLVLKSGHGTNPCEPVCIVAEGTTFYNLRGLKHKVEYYLKSYLENEKGVYTEIVGIENSTLVGAAVAGLTN